MRKIIVNYDVFKKICEFSSQYANFRMPKEDWVECMGYLFCKITQAEDKDYIIQDAVGITSGSEMRVEMTPDDLAKIEQLESDRSSMFLGGWWHTHPGLSLFFSDTDIDNQTFYQQGNEDGLGIVFDLNLIDEEFIGFTIFRLKSKNSREYIELEYELEGFTKEKLKEAFNFLGGIPNHVIHNLSIHYGFNSEKPLKSPEIEIPQTDSPLEEGDNYFKISKVSQIRRNYSDAAMKMEIASILYEQANEYEMAADSYIDAVEYCFKAEKPEYIKRILDRYVDILEGNKIEAHNYYKAKYKLLKAKVHEFNQNLSLAADELKKALLLYDKNEDFGEIFEASNMRAILLEKMKDYKNALIFYKNAKNYALKAKEESEDDSEEKDWEQTIANLNLKIKNLESNVKQQGLQRIV